MVFGENLFQPMTNMMYETLLAAGKSLPVVIEGDYTSRLIDAHIILTNGKGKC